MAAERDRWAAWLLERRQGGDEELYRLMLEKLRPVRERVLDNAGVREGDVVLDVGTGDGLIALGALERVGRSGRVIFSDISPDCLDYCRELTGGDERAEFLLASADELAPIADSSVDVVTTRSVIIYLDRAAKEQAVSEFHRVLRPGGRLSMFEPINRFGCEERQDDSRFFGLDTGPVSDLARKVRLAYDAMAPGEETLVDFDERDLLAWAEAAGFVEVELDYNAKIASDAAFGWDRNGDGPSWDVFVNSSGNPLAPTLAEVLEQALTEEERERFVAVVRPAFESRQAISRHAAAYLRAVKG